MTEESGTTRWLASLIGGKVMATDDTAGKKARADRLRAQIEQLKTDEEEKPAEAKKPPEKRETPRDFVQRRMREIQEGQS
jgi:hypothetical protein